MTRTKNNMYILKINFIGILKKKSYDILFGGNNNLIKKKKERKIYLCVFLNNARFLFCN